MNKQEKQELKRLKYLAKDCIKQNRQDFKQAYCFLGFESDNGCEYCGLYWKCLIHKMLYLENKALKEKILCKKHSEKHKELEVC